MPRINPNPTGPRTPREDMHWSLVFVAEYSNCAQGRRRRDPVGCIRFAEEVANDAVWAMRRSQIN